MGGWGGVVAVGGSVVRAELGFVGTGCVVAEGLRLAIRFVSGSRWTPTTGCFFDRDSAGDAKFSQDRMADRLLGCFLRLDSKFKNS